MRIKQITDRHRRDFTAVYECEHCGATDTSSGYDDDNFHRNVIPAMKCKACGKTAPDSYCPRGTLYPPDEVDDAGEYYNFGPAGCGIEESRNLTEEEAWLIIETLRSVME